MSLTETTTVPSRDSLARVHASAGRRVTDGVGNQVRERPGELDLVSGHDVGGGSAAVEGHAFFRGLNREELDDAPDDGLQVHGLTLHRDRHGARPREIEEALRDVGEPLDVLMGDVEETSQLGIEPLGPLREHLDRHAQRGERRAELVGERRHEVLASALLIADVSHVLERENEARGRSIARVERRQAQNVKMIPSAKKQRDLEALTLLLGMLEEVAHGFAQA